MDSNPKILRKLGAKEKYILRRGSSEVFTITFRIRSEIDLFDNKKLVKNAIAQWKTTQPFLNASIFKHAADDDYYLIENNQTNLTNVTFLALDFDKFNNLDSQLVSQLVADLLEEKYLYKSFDEFAANDSLWKLNFLKNGRETNDFQYNVVMVFHHVIADGISAYINFLKLLKIIEQMHKNDSSLHEAYKPLNILPPSEQLFHSKGYFSPNYAQIYRGRFINPERAKFAALNSKKYRILDDFREESLSDSETSKELFKIGDLIDLSKQSPSKFKRFLIEQETTLKLLKICKEKRVKFSSFLLTVLCLALKLLYKKHGDETLNDIVYYAAVSLRQFRTDLGGEYIPNDLFGYYVGGTALQFSEHVHMSHTNEWTSRFWSLCEQENNKLHAQVHDDCIFVNFPKLNDPEKQMSMHFGFSNIGAMPSTLSNDRPLIQVLQNSLCSNIRENLKNRYFFNCISTVNSRVNWLLTYNAFFIDEFLLDNMIELIYVIIDRLID